MASNKANELQEKLSDFLTDWNQQAYQKDLPEVTGVWDSHGTQQFTAQERVMPAKVADPSTPMNPVMESYTELSTDGLFRAASPLSRSSPDTPTHAPRLPKQLNHFDGSSPGLLREKGDPLVAWKGKFIGALAMVMDQNMAKDERVRVSTELCSELVSAIEDRLEQRFEVFKENLRGGVVRIESK
jgi:hypothetical protein